MSPAPRDFHFQIARLGAVLLGTGAILSAQEDLDAYKPPAPLPAAADVLAGVRARLPRETLFIKGEMMRGARRENLERVFFVDVMLNLGKTPATARYTLRDNFGTPTAQLTIIRQAGIGDEAGATEFRYEQGQPLQPAPLPELERVIAGTDITWNDLNLAWLWRRNGATVGREIVRACECAVLDFPQPGAPPVAAAAEPGLPAPPRSAVMRVWIAEKMLFLVQMEEYDSRGALLRRLSVKNFKKIAGMWMVKNMEVRSFVSNQRTCVQIEDMATSAGPPAREDAGETEDQ